MSRDFFTPSPLQAPMTISSTKSWMIGLPGTAPRFLKSLVPAMKDGSLVMIYEYPLSTKESMR